MQAVSLAFLTDSSLKVEVGSCPTSLEMIILSAVQSFVQMLIHSAILFINTSTILGTTKIIG